MLLIRSDFVNFKIFLNYKILSICRTVFSWEKLLMNLEVKINLFLMFFLGSGAGPCNFALWKHLFIILSG